jgi:hypothetical protein
MFGKRPNEAELLDEIRQMDARHTVSLLARINLLLVLDRFHSDDGHTTELQTFLVNLLIDDDLFSHLKNAFGTERLADRRPFHSLQILMLIKRVTLEGSKIGGMRPDIDKEPACRLGRCLMMMNDFLVTPENIAAIRPDRPSMRRKIALQLQLGSSLEVSNPPASTRVLCEAIRFSAIS